MSLRPPPSNTCALTERTGPGQNDVKDIFRSDDAVNFPWRRTFSYSQDWREAPPTTFIELHCDLLVVESFSQSFAARRNRWRRQRAFSGTSSQVGTWLSFMTHGPASDATGNSTWSVDLQSDWDLLQSDAHLLFLCVKPWLIAAGSGNGTQNEVCDLPVSLSRCVATKLLLPFFTDGQAWCTLRVKKLTWRMFFV